MRCSWRLDNLMPLRVSTQLSGGSVRLGRQRKAGQIDNLQRCSLPRTLAHHPGAFGHGSSPVSQLIRGMPDALQEVRHTDGRKRDCGFIIERRAFLLDGIGKRLLGGLRAKMSSRPPQPPTPMLELGKVVKPYRRKSDLRTVSQRRQRPPVSLTNNDQRVENRPTEIHRESLGN